MVEECGTEPSRLQANKQHETLTHIAMDGKTLRGTLQHHSEGQPAVHLLGFYDCHSGIVQTHRAVANKENEISAVTALLHPALVKGRIISTDALHTQRKWCTGVHTYGEYYLSLVKENQLTLYEDIQDFFDDSDAERDEWQYTRTSAKRAWASGNTRNLDEYADE